MPSTLRCILFAVAAAILFPAQAQADTILRDGSGSRLATIETLEARFAFDVTLVTNDFRALPISVPDAQFSGQYLTSGILSATFDATLALTGNLDFVDFDSAPQACVGGPCDPPGTQPSPRLPGR